MAGLLTSICLSTAARAQEPEQEVSPAQEEAGRPRSHREQRDHYVWGTFGPPGLIGAFLSSDLQQWRDAPREWGPGANGYAKRFASEYTEGAVTDTTKYLVARMLDEDPSFRPCNCTGFIHRLRHAALGPISARKPDGRTVFSLARVVGMTAGKGAAAAWYPGQQGVKGVATHVAVDFAGTVGVDILREFVLHRRAGR